MNRFFFRVWMNKVENLSNLMHMLEVLLRLKDFMVDSFFLML